MLILALTNAVLCVSVLPLWWCYCRQADRQETLRRDLALLRDQWAKTDNKTDDLDEVVARLCETAGVPVGEVRK